MRLLSKSILFVAVALSYLFLFYWFGVLNLFALAPWDTAIFQPDLGTWQRTLNDFFDIGIGNWLVLIISAVAFGIPIFKTLRRRWDASLRVLVANLLLIILGYGMVILAQEINGLFFTTYYGELPPNQPFLNHSYSRSIIPLIIYWLSYVIWYREIQRLGKHVIKAKNKAKNTSYHQAVTRLADSDSTQVIEPKSQNTLASSHQVSTQ